ncbi:MAG: hypothetical protein DHS80DRAFT_24223 [Piptocephalis tieghemiana]|nr:MAG: hypothetical protein DHS80DRAFT_24223 [Piptocephalis tieghemiana]
MSMSDQEALQAAQQWCLSSTAPNHKANANRPTNSPIPSWPSPLPPPPEALEVLVHVWKKACPQLTATPHDPETGSEEDSTQTSEGQGAGKDQESRTISASTTLPTTWDPEAVRGMVNSLSSPEIRATLLLSLLSLRPHDFKASKSSLTQLIQMAGRDKSEWVKLLGKSLVHFPEERRSTAEFLDGDIIENFDMRMEMLGSILEGMGISFAGPVDAYLCHPKSRVPEGEGRTRSPDKQKKSHSPGYHGGIPGLSPVPKVLSVEEVAESRRAKLQSLAKVVPTPITTSLSSGGGGGGGGASGLTSPRTPGMLVNGSPMSPGGLGSMGGNGQIPSPGGPMSTGSSSPSSGSIFLRRRPSQYGNQGLGMGQGGSGGGSSIFLKTRQPSASSLHTHVTSASAVGTGHGGTPLSPRQTGRPPSLASVVPRSSQDSSTTPSSSSSPLDAEGGEGVTGFRSSGRTEFGKASRVRMLDVSEGESIMREREEAKQRKLQEEQEERMRKAAAKKEEAEQRKAQEEERRKERQREREEARKAKAEAAASKAKGRKRAKVEEAEGGVTGSSSSSVDPGEEDVFRHPTAPSSTLDTDTDMTGSSDGKTLNVTSSSTSTSTTAVPSAHAPLQEEGEPRRTGLLDGPMNALSPNHREFIEAFMRSDTDGMRRKLVSGDTTVGRGKKGQNQILIPLSSSPSPHRLLAHGSTSRTRGIQYCTASRGSSEESGQWTDLPRYTDPQPQCVKYAVEKGKKKSSDQPSFYYYYYYVRPSYFSFLNVSVICAWRERYEWAVAFEQ